MHLPVQGYKGTGYNFANVVGKALEAHLNSFGFDLVDFSYEVLHVGGISAVHEEGEIDEPEGLVGVLFEDEGHVIVLHFDDF